MENFQEDIGLLVKIEAEFKKVFNENNKLRKQGALINGDSSSIFMCSRNFKKDYLCTYIHAYDGTVDEVQFSELKDLVNPNIYKKGVFIISKYQYKLCLDSDSSPSSHNNSTGPLNSTELSDYGYNGDKSVDDSQEVVVVFEEFKVVNCGNCELFATDVNVGGARAFHGALGQFTKANLSLHNLTPVSSVNGRYLASVYIQFLKHLSIEVAPAFLICCESKRPMNICKSIIFPEHSEGQMGRLHIVTMFDGGNGKISKRVREEKGQSTYLSTYDMYQTVSGCRTNGETSLQIKFHWSGNDCETMQPPPPSAKPVIHLQVTAGEQRSAANEVYLELKRLDTIVNTPINNTSTFFNSTYSEQVLSTLKSFKDTVADIQFYDNTGRNATGSVSENTDDIETPMSQLLMESFGHKDIDFTDSLWTLVLKSSELEIRYILDDILTDIVNGSLQPAISPNNETKLAKHIRKLYVAGDDDTKADAKEKIMELIGNDQSIVNLVREIGFVKMRKDYFNFFISRGLTSLSSLQKICKPSVIDIAALWKLHYCLEIVITPTIYLNLTPDCQCTLLTAAIDYYSVNGVDTMSPTFCLSLLPFHESSSSLQSLCESRQPVMWQNGFVHANKAGFNEVIIKRIQINAAIEGNETEVDNSKEEKLLIREETIPLPDVKC